RDGIDGGRCLCANGGARLWPLAIGVIAVSDVGCDRRLFCHRHGLTSCRQARACEVTRMTQAPSLLEVYAMASPFVVFAIALGVYWITGWLDDRALRRKTDRAIEWGVHRN